MAFGLGVYALVWCLLAVAVPKHAMGATVAVPGYEEQRNSAREPIFEAVFGIADGPFTADSIKMGWDAERNEKSKLVADSFIDSRVLYKSDAEEMVTEDVIDVNNDVISSIVESEASLTVNAKTEVNEEVKPKGTKTTTPRPHQRGEHVINNNVKKVLPNIIDSFLDKNRSYFNNQIFRALKESGFISPSMEVYKAHEHPLSEEDVDQITNRMKVHAPQGQTVSDANAEKYGRDIKQYNSLVVEYMSKLFLLATKCPREISDHHIDQRYIRRAREIIRRAEGMCSYPTYGVFVDDQALGWWLDKGGNKSTFLQVRNDVVNMFHVVSQTNVGAVQWVKELFNISNITYPYHI